MTKYEVGKHFTKGEYWVGLAFVVNTEMADDENCFLNLQETVELLNTLHQENQELKQENDKYRVMINANASLNDEVYEQLKKTEKSYKECRKENEKLQKENNDYEKQFRIINEKLDEYIKTADTYRIPISSLKYGDDLGYFNGVHQYMKKLKKDIEGLDMSEKRFTVKSIKNNHYQIAENDLKMLSNEVDDLLNSLNEENEQLRQTMQKVYKLLEEEVDDI